MAYSLEIWKHEPEEDVLVDAFVAEEPLDLLGEVHRWAAMRSMQLREPVYVWCIRRDRLLVFHAGSEEFYTQARHLIDDIEIFEGMFRVPQREEIAQFVNHPSAEHHINDCLLKVTPK